MHGVKDRQAILRYLDGTYEILQNGEFVLCAMTRQRIPLEDLRYWDVPRQEAYSDAWAALRALRTVR